MSPSSSSSSSSSTDLQALCDGLWSIHHRRFVVGGFLGIGTRSTLFRLGDGTLALHAPGPLSPAHLDAIRALGTVSLLILPNRMHTMFAAAAASAFPQARVLATPGLSASGLTIHDSLDGPLPDSLRDVAEIRPLGGCPKLEERVIFLPASRTLVGVDLAFNLHNLTGLTRLVMWLNNANDRFCVTRLARSQFIGDAPTAGRSVQSMLDAWDFDRIVIAHGEVRETGGHAALRDAWSFAMS